MKKLTVTLLLIISASLGFAQSGWTKQKGELYSQFTFSKFWSSNFYNLSGQNLETNQFNQYNTTIYAEYGVNDRFTTILNSTLLRSNSYETTNSAIGPSDLHLELKYAISKKIPISISIAPEIPLGSQDNFAQEKELNPFGFFNEVNLPTTDGDFNVWSTVAASSSFLENKFWSNVYFSYNKRTKEFSDQYKAGLEIGYKPIEKLYVKTTFSTLGNFTSTPNPSASFIRGEGTKSTAVSIGLGVALSDSWGIIADYSQGINFLQKAKNTYLGPQITAGITYVIKPKGE